MTVLVIEHEKECPPGLLWQTGLPLQVARPYAGDPLPETSTGLRGLIVLGGEMNAYEDEAYPWLPQTRRLIAEAAEAGLPTLLICLGHQLGAIALGGRVEASEHGVLMGVQNVGLTDAGRTDPLLQHLSPQARVMHWNGDVVSELPAGATVLARDPHGQVQAVRYGMAMWGLQCHPEVDVSIVRAWGHLDDPTHPPVADAESAIASLRAHEAAVRSAWAGVFEAFASLTGQEDQR